MKRAPYSTRVIKHLLENAETLKLSGHARLRLTWFYFAATHAWNVSKTCRHFGIATTTFTRWMHRFNPHDPESLEERPRRSNRASGLNENSEVVAFIERCRRESPYVNNGVIRRRLEDEHGLRISNATIGRIIQRHCFFFGSTPAHQEKRPQLNDAQHSDSSLPPITSLNEDSREEGDLPYPNVAPVFGA